MPDGNPPADTIGKKVTTTNPFQAWLDAFRPDPKLSALGAASGQVMEAWAKAWQAALTGRMLPAMGLMNPLAWAEQGRDAAEVLEDIFGMPQWSDAPSLDSETLKGVAPAVELMQVGQSYAAATAQVCLDICTTFQKRLAEDGLKLDGSGEALDLWNNIVDERLTAFNRSDSFADLQRRFLRALMAYQLQQRRMAGRLAEHFHLPTREEADELGRRIHDLEREVRRLRRALPPAASPERSKEQ